MNTNKTWLIGAGMALWLPLLFSFMRALRAPRLPGVAASQLLMVALLVLATLLLGMLIGRSACVAEPGR
jgi:hypothetical protein